MARCHAQHRQTAFAKNSLRPGSAWRWRHDVVRQQLTAVDGSVVTTLARVAGLCWTPKGTGKAASGYRLHTQFEVLHGLPSRIDVTPANPRDDGHRSPSSRRSASTFWDGRVSRTWSLVSQKPRSRRECSCAPSRRRRGRRCAESGCLFSTQPLQMLRSRSEGAS